MMPIEHVRKHERQLARRCNLGHGQLNELRMFVTCPVCGS